MSTNHATPAATISTPDLAETLHGPLQAGAPSGALRRAQERQRQAREEALQTMRAGAYVCDGDKVMLLVPDGLGPADASGVARERLGHTGDLDMVSFRAAGPGCGVYVTYQALPSTGGAA